MSRSHASKNKSCAYADPDQESQRISRVGAGEGDVAQSARDLSASEAVEKSFADDELLADWLPPRPAGRCDPEVQVQYVLATVNKHASWILVNIL